jgi:hypothetical protein
VVIEELQAAEDLLLAARQKGKDVGRAEKAVLEDAANRLQVPLRKRHWNDLGDALKAGTAN